MINEMIGKKVIIRGDRSGVFFGTLAEKQGQEVVLTKEDYGGEVIRMVEERYG